MVIAYTAKDAYQCVSDSVRTEHLVGSWCYGLELVRLGSTSGFLYLWLAVFIGLAKRTLCFIIVTYFIVN